MRKGLLFLFLLAASYAQAQDLDVIQYSFSIQVNDHNDSINGSAGITFVTKTNKPEVQFDLAIVDASRKGMHVDNVKGSGEKQLQFRQERDKLVIQLPEISKDSLQHVLIAYRGIPKDGLIISKNKFGERTFFSDHWPDRAHQWIPCNDRPDDKAKFRFQVVAPSHYSVISNGIKKEEREIGTGLKRTHWEEETPLAPKVMAIGIARFAIKTYPNNQRNLPISAWVYPKDSTKGFYDYAITPQIVDFFSGYIAPFPFQKLANVQSTTIFGGMENASCIFYDESSITGDRREEGLMAHEIAHQWFGNMATEKSFAHLWLSEGFATYLTNFYMESRYGKEAMLEKLRDDREKVIRFTRTAAPAVVDSTENLMSLLNANSYQKGGWVLRMLRDEVGDTTFRKIIQAYYNRYKGSNAETKDFQQIAEQVSGKELKWFFDQWLYRPGIPKLTVRKIKEGDTLKLKIIQRGAVYRLPLTICVTGDGGKMVKEKLLLTDAETESTWRGPITAGADVLLDPDCTLLFVEVKNSR